MKKLLTVLIFLLCVSFVVTSSLYFIFDMALLIYIGIGGISLLTFAFLVFFIKDIILDYEEPVLEKPLNLEGDFSYDENDNQTEESKKTIVKSTLKKLKENIFRIIAILLACITCITLTNVFKKQTETPEILKVYVSNESFGTGYVTTYAIYKVEFKKTGNSGIDNYLKENYSYFSAPVIGNKCNEYTYGYKNITTGEFFGNLYYNTKPYKILKELNDAEGTDISEFEMKMTPIRYFPVEFKEDGSKVTIEYFECNKGGFFNTKKEAEDNMVYSVQKMYGASIVKVDYNT